MKLAAVLLALACAGCLRLSFRRETAYSAPGTGTLERLEPGRANLAECLAALGSPLFAWEYDGDGMALAWGWKNEHLDGVRISIPVARQIATDFEYQLQHLNLYGVVLFFGEDLVLQDLHRGHLRDLVPTRQRPAFVEDDGDGAAGS